MVSLSAGAIGSPQLMQASGLGPAGLLAERLVAEAERGIPEQKLRRRGRPSMGEETSSATPSACPMNWWLSSTNALR